MSKKASAKGAGPSASASSSSPSTAAGSPRKKAKSQKDKKHASYQHPVYKNKVKCKKLFQALDPTKRGRLTKADFVAGLRKLFDREEVEASDLGLEMLWEQMEKDETGKYCSWNDFAFRFLVDSKSKYALAEKVKTEDELATANAPKKIASSDFKRLQEALYYVLKKWRLEDASVIEPPRSGLTYTKKQARKAVVAMFAAERAQARAQGRSPETWAIYASLNDADADKLLDFADWGRNDACKSQAFLEALEKRIPAPRRARPTEPAGPPRPELLAFPFDIPASASALPAVELATVPLSSLRDWVADVVFFTQREAPLAPLRAGAQFVTPDEPLLAFPAPAHWDEAATATHGVASLEDARTEKGGLLFFTQTVAVPAVKRPPPAKSGADGKTAYGAPLAECAAVVYAQFLYCCQSAVEGGAVCQWRLRAKLYLNKEERPVKIVVEDNAMWVNGEVTVNPPHPLMTDWDFPNLPFQSQTN
mgnify:CR=1 FL=1